MGMVGGSGRGSARRGCGPDAGRGSRARRGQALAEFALVLLPLLLVLLGIIQMGLVFNAQVTITNAAREGARTATIYVYDQTIGGKSQNDIARANAALSALKSSMGILSTSAPQLTNGGTWTSSGTAPNLTYTNGDITVSYTQGSVTDSDARTGEQVTVSLVYHQDLLIPMIANLLPKDANGRLAQRSTVTMVIN